MSTILPPRVLFRADGNVTLGLGHVIRCQALAQALQPLFVGTFVLRNPTLDLRQQLASIGLEVVTIPESVLPGLVEAQWLADYLLPSDIVVLDGYHFTSDYQQVIAARCPTLVCLDDLITPPTWAAVVLNQAGSVSPAAYTAVPLAHLCIGPAYALLRPPFWQKPIASQSANPPRLFLNMGGADPGNQTLALLPRLQHQFSSYQIEVVTGAAYPHRVALAAYQQKQGPQVHLHHNLSAAELASLLRTCQVFVCPPSGVAYECCAVGGAVLLHLTADNQAAMCDFLVSEGLAVSLAEALALSEIELPALADEQRLRQRALFDGKAAERLQKVFQDLAASQQYHLRRAEATDAALYFGWVNDPAVRQNAIHPDPIVWDTHVAWFERRLQDSNSYLYLLYTAAGEPVGQVRVEFEGVAAPGIIDYSLAPAHRGQGLGQMLLWRALQRLRHERPILAGGAVVGQVKANNAASARVFERLRFMRQAAVTLQGETYEVFRLDFPLGL